MDVRSQQNAPGFEDKVFVFKYRAHVSDVSYNMRIIDQFFSKSSHRGKNSNANGLADGMVEIVCLPLGYVGGALTLFAPDVR